MYCIDSRLVYRYIVSIVTEEKKRVQIHNYFNRKLFSRKMSAFFQTTTRQFDVGCSKSLSETDSQRERENVHKVYVL